MNKYKMKNDIPKIVWMYWHQGFDNAPFLVQKCRDSWLEKNDGWEIRLIDKNNVGQFASGPIIKELNKKNISINHFSDLLRVDLLSNHGGIWVDATLFCNTPLDNWIDECGTTGFFAFRNHKKDRELASWFLVSSRSNLLTEKWCDIFYRYLNENSFRDNVGVVCLLTNLLTRLLGFAKMTTLFWTNHFVIRFLKLRPYFIFHYWFYFLIRENANLREIWERTPYVDAEICHKIQQIGFVTKLDALIVKEIKECVAPVFKLDWKCDIDDSLRSTVIGYILGVNK